MGLPEKGFTEVYKGGLGEILWGSNWRRPLFWGPKGGPDFLSFGKRVTFFFWGGLNLCKRHRFKGWGNFFFMWRKILLCWSNWVSYFRSCLGPKKRVGGKP